MKKVLFFVLVCISITSCFQKKSENPEWIPFTWESGYEWGKYIEKMTIYIPVTIDNLPYNFTMQFDLGTSYSGFYVNSLKPFLEKYPSLKNKLDSTLHIYRKIDLKLGKVLFEDIDISQYKMGTEYSLDSINSGSEIEIGTIGVDLIQNKVLIIDYNLNRLAITETLPAEYQNVIFEEFKIENGLIKLPFRINGNSEYLMFDTGASYFRLATTKQNALAISGTEIIDSLKVTSWGKHIAFYGRETVVPIFFGDKIMEKTIVYYDEEASFDDIYQSINVWGLTGNGYFLNDLIIIDYKNNRFGVK